MTTLDRRRHAFRPDLADVRLKGKVPAQRFVTGRAMRVAVPVADLRCAPGTDQRLDTQLLLGQDVAVFDEAIGPDGAIWAWCQAKADGYVGYVERAHLSTDQTALSHSVIVPRTFVFPATDLKQPPRHALSMGSLLSLVDWVTLRGTEYAVLGSGEAVPARHVAPLSQMADDFVEVAQRLGGTPYLWGGASGFGIDCSGLVQQALRMSGVKAPRDSDMQEAEIGEPLSGSIAKLMDEGGLQRGDLVFWPGHVGILTDQDALLHANAYHMATVIEPFATALKRLNAAGIEVSSIRRLLPAER